MTTQPLQTLKGFRDLMPAEKRQRDFVAGKIIEAFQKFGFEPLETPTLEYAELLLDKYGEEADKLVYTFEDRGGRKIGLRYDQTVPTARILAQYRNNLPKFFRRYQIQNVFRADKPQQGRYREFTQCDIDIFGSTSPLVDAEILACTFAAYQNIGFKEIQLKINDRKTLLDALEPFATIQVDVFSIIQSVDKLDKQTPQEVAAELVKKGLETKQAQAALGALENLKPSENLQAIINQANLLGVPEESLAFSPALARGLDYYTGMIFEIILPGYEVGSCGGGGRYDNLIGDLCDYPIPAVGVGIGFDRTVEAAAQLGLIPETAAPCQALVTIFSEELLPQSLKITQQLREQGVSTIIYPKNDSLGKQFKYANQQNIPWVVIIGEEEAATSSVTVKNMQTGEQTTMKTENLVETISLPQSPPEKT